jgi:hypothetical protein
MTIELFDFPDTLQMAAKYERLGFKVEIDDPINNIWHALFKAEGKCDAAALLGLMLDCEFNGLEPNIELDNKLMPFKEGLDVVDKIAAADTYINGVGTIL